MSDASPRRDGRDLGIDAFRGLTVILMAVVNLQGNDEAAFTLLKHAAWNGLTFADLVFPWFILLVGLSVPLALRAGRPPALADVARRAAVLFLIGVVLGWLIRPTLDLDQIRWVGVLQRIAVVYLACVIVAQRMRGALVPAAFAAALLGVHALVLLFVAAPGEPSPSLAMGQGISAWMDQMILPGRLHRGTWDPEGAWSTISAIASGLLGVAASRLRDVRGRGGVAVLAALMIIAGVALSPILPLNKALWTASYVFIASGTGLGLWLLLGGAASVDHGATLLAPAVFAGRTALTFYVVHMLLIAVLVRTMSGETLWSRGFEAVQGLGLPGPLASLAFALVATGLSLAPIPWLKQRGWLIRA